MYINTFRYTPEYVDCKLCTEYAKKIGCTATHCPWLMERIEAGVVGYKEVISEALGNFKPLHRRLRTLIRQFRGRSGWTNNIDIVWQF